MSLLEYSLGGTTLRTLGIIAENTRALHRTPAFANDLVAVADRAGAIVSRSVVGPRVAPVSFSIIRSTTALRLASEDSLASLLGNGATTLSYSREDGSVRELSVLLRGELDIQRLSPLVSRAAFTLEAPDPRWSASADTTVTIAAPATDYACALGTAPSDGVISITGATNPTVTIKNGAAVAQVTLVFAAYATGGDDLLIDLTRREIEHDDGSPANIIDELTSGVWPFRMLPSWYSGATAPTIRTSSGTGTFVYRKRYW